MHFELFHCPIANGILFKKDQSNGVEGKVLFYSLFIGYEFEIPMKSLSGYKNAIHSIFLPFYCVDCLPPIPSLQVYLLLLCS